MQLSAYLIFNGDCRAAFEFYAQCLGGQLEAMQCFGEMPVCDQVSADWHDKIMHARLNVGGQLLMGSDNPPDMYQPMQGFSVALGVDDPAQAERLFAALSEGGTVRMPMQETVWATRFGMLVDRFGVAWMVNCEQAGSPTATGERA